MLYDSALERRLEDGLDLMIKHVDASRPAWPRLIAIKGRWNTLAHNKQEALAHFKAANFLDCRISAYNLKDNNAYTAPSVLQVDLDREYFTTDEELELAAAKTLANFDKILGGHPTQMWTGNGYHFIQPQFSIILGLKGSMFEKFREPSRRFMQYQEQLLTDDKADKNHSRIVSFANLWLRVPGSLNYNEILFDKNGEIIDIPPKAEVRVVQYWDGNWPSIKPLLPRYHIWLESELVKSLDTQMELQNNQESWSRRRKGRWSKNKSKNTINWIEKLLETPIGDFRKCSIKFILARYLMNIRGLSRDDTSKALLLWLNKCDLVCRLDFDINQKVDEALNMVAGYLPMGRQKIIHDYNHMYLLLEEKGVFRKPKKVGYSVV